MQREIKRINLRLTKEQKNTLDMNKSIYKSFMELNLMTWENYFLMISEEINNHIRELIDKHGDRD